MDSFRRLSRPCCHPYLLSKPNLRLLGLGHTARGFPWTWGSQIGKPWKNGVKNSLSPSFSTRGVGDPGSRSRSTSWSKGLYHRSDVLVLIQKLSARANARWRLGWQREIELFEQEFVIGLWMGVAA